ncbi:hypothetical protein ADL27_46705, partial [Streptomyces sp. NRRL F-6602]
LVGVHHLRRLAHADRLRQVLTALGRDNGHLEDVIQQLINLPGVVRTRTEVALRERVAHRVLPLVASVGRR